MNDDGSRTVRRPSRAGDDRWSTPAAWAAGVAAFAVYVRTLYPSVPGGDAGELIAAAATGGVAHPPGYPLYTLLGGLFAAIPYGSPAWRLNLFSAVCGAAAAAVLAQVVWRWTRRSGAAILAGGAFASSPLVWTYATGAEVFALNNLIVASLLWLAIEWGHRPSRRLAVLFAALFGLGLANHQIALFVGAPLALWLLWSGRRVLGNAKSLLLLGGAGALGLSLYLYLPIAAAAEPQIVWGDFATMSGLLDHVLRREYGTFQLGQNFDVAPGDVSTRLLAYARSLAESFAWIGVPLGLWGAYLGLTRRDLGARSFGAVLLATWLFYLASFHLLANLPVQLPLYREVTARFWQQAHLVFAVWIGVGYAALSEPIARRAPRLPVLLAIALVAGCAAARFAQQDQSDNHYLATYARAIVEPLPRGSVLLTKGDLVTNTVRYLQACEGVRADVMILDQELMTRPWYVAARRKQLADVTFPAARYEPGRPDGFAMADLIAANPDLEFYVYPEWKAGDPTTSTSSALLSLQPRGFASRVFADTTTQSFAGWDADRAARWRELRSLEWPPADHYGEGTWERVVLDDYWQAELRSGLWALTWALQHPQAPESSTALDAAIETFAGIARSHYDPPWYVYKNLGLAEQRRGDDPIAEQALRAWRRYLELAPPDEPDRRAIELAVQAGGVSPPQ